MKFDIVAPSTTNLALSSTNIAACPVMSVVTAIIIDFNSKEAVSVTLTP